MYVASFAEYLIDGKDIPPDPWNIDVYRSRLAVLLYNHGRMKQEENAISEDESTGRLAGVALASRVANGFRKTLLENHKSFLKDANM